MNRNDFNIKHVFNSLMASLFFVATFSADAIGQTNQGTADIRQLVDKFLTKEQDSLGVPKSLIENLYKISEFYACPIVQADASGRESYAPYRSSYSVMHDRDYPGRDYLQDHNGFLLGTIFFGLISNKFIDPNFVSIAFKNEPPVTLFSNKSLLYFIDPFLLFPAKTYQNYNSVRKRYIYDNFYKNKEIYAKEIDKLPDPAPSDPNEMLVKLTVFNLEYFKKLYSFPELSVEDEVVLRIFRQRPRNERKIYHIIKNPVLIDVDNNQTTIFTPSRRIDHSAYGVVIDRMEFDGGFDSLYVKGGVDPVRKYKCLKLK